MYAVLRIGRVRKLALLPRKPESLQKETLVEGVIRDSTMYVVLFITGAYFRRSEASLSAVTEENATEYRFYIARPAE